MVLPLVSDHFTTDAKILIINVALSKYLQSLDISYTKKTLRIHTSMNEITKTATITLNLF